MDSLEATRSGLKYALQASTGSLASVAGLYGVLFHVLVLRKLSIDEFSYTFLGVYLAAAVSARAVPYVEDVINEALRLKPAVISGGFRTTPPKGIVVDDVHVPGGINVNVPMQLIQTDTRYHERAEEFLPERWGEKRAEWRTEQQPWVPFSIGPFSCPGKSLAMAALRVAVSQIAQSFDVAFAPGEDGVDFDEGALDTFTTTLPPLMVQFTPRA